MYSTAQTTAVPINGVSDKILSFSSAAWLATALLGQWLFVIYITLFYGGSLLSNNLQKWAEVLPNGIVEGESLGNFMIIVHIMLPIYVMAAGGLQLLPSIRNRFAKFHRANGRVYLITAIITSITGIITILTRGTIGDGIQHLLTTFNGLLILLFAYFTYDMAIRKNIVEHRQWAMRLFVVVSGVWTFRVMLMIWLTVNGGPVGFDMESFTGPALKLIGVAQFVIPLLILEAYFSAQKSHHAIVKLATSLLLIATILCMCIGIFAAFTGMWLPRIS